MDGAILTDAVQNRGINMRYLGKITAMLAKVPQLEYIYTIAESEVVMRSAKHIFTVYLQGLDMLSLSCAVSQFLNCLLSSCPTPVTAIPDQLHSKKRGRNRSKKQTKQSPLTPTDSVEWANITPKSLWAQVKAECKAYYDWDLPVNSIDGFVETFTIAKHINPRATDTYNFYTTGQSKIQNVFLKNGYELISEALNLLNNVYVAMHPEIAQFLGMVAR